MNKYEPFDYSRFEKLQGIELGLYCMSKPHPFRIDNDFLKYFEETSNNLDTDHLQYAVSLLGEIKTIEAYRMVAKYIDHPETEVRFPAIKILTNFEDYENIDQSILNDGFITDKVDKTLKKHSDWFAVKELKVLLDRRKVNKGLDDKI